MASETESWSAAILALSYEQRADWLERKLTYLAQARVDHMTAYADAFLTAEGTDRQREQHARLAGAGAHLVAETIAAQVRAFQFLFNDSTEDS